MTPAQVWLITNGLFWNEPTQDLSEQITKVEIEFWPRRSLGDGWVYPDLVISYSRHSEMIRELILEVKWESGASNRSGESGDQLSSQVASRSAKPRSRDCKQKLVYLVRYLSTAQREVDSGNQKIGHLAIVKKTWQEVREWCADQKSRKDSNSGKWALLVDVFLEQSGVYNFHGFKDAISTEIDQSANWNFCR